MGGVREREGSRKVTGGSIVFLIVRQASLSGRPVAVSGGLGAEARAIPRPNGVHTGWGRRSGRERRRVGVGTGAGGGAAGANLPLPQACWMCRALGRRESEGAGSFGDDRRANMGPARRGGGGGAPSLGRDSARSTLQAAAVGRDSSRPESSEAVARYNIRANVMCQRFPGKQPERGRWRKGSWKWSQGGWNPADREHFRLPVRGRCAAHRDLGGHLRPLRF